MKNNRVNRLPGLKDSSGPSYRKFRFVVEKLASFLGSSGYEVIDTPLLEHAELFVRKSGGEMSSQIYTFVDPSGTRVSLRPEFTSSVIRHFIQQMGSNLPPVRWQYSGPVFRYQNTNDGEICHQFVQLGAEFIGDSDLASDAEILSLAWHGLQKIDPLGYRVVVGHVGIIYDILEQFGLSEATKLFVNSNVKRLKTSSTSIQDLLCQAEDAGLLNTNQIVLLSNNMEDGGSGLERERVLEFLNNELPSPYGQRTLDDIADRLLRKAEEADSPEVLETALTFVQELVQIEGNYDEAIAQSRFMYERQGLSTNVLIGFKALFDELGMRGVDMTKLVVDFGLPSGIAYYTGIIFNIHHVDGTGDVIVGSGGRYDGLVKALGGSDIPALGFAYNVDRILEVIN